MKLDSDAFPINVVELGSKKMLIRSDQTESARKKNVVDDNASPRMIKQKKSRSRSLESQWKKETSSKTKAVS